MRWDTLISDKRLGLEHYHDPKPGARNDFQRDFDRLVFSSPFRRLQNKTQVFPLPGNIFVHNRLTHSLEVSCVGRSLAREVAIRLRSRYSDDITILDSLSYIGDIVAAACLAHDLGNPPFGHSGEKAIQAYFSEGAGRSLRDKLSPKEWDDLTHFEGNANAFRLLTHRFNGRRKGGFAMTYSTLASIVKYPFESSLAGSHGKFGFFTSEKDDFIKVADELGMTRLHTGDGEIRYARHPLVYIVEAADDICYEIMDIEDAHKLKILSTDEIIPLLLGYFDDTRKARIEHVMSNVDDPNERIAYLRSCIIGILVEKCADAFAAHEQEILDGSFSGSLLDHITPLEKECYRKCEELSWNKIYCASDVVEIELAGTRIISFLIDELVNAVSDPTLNYSRLLLAKVPEQYEINSPTLYGKIQAILDHISGMTDVYALDLYRRLNGMSLKINN
ncbi:dGTP triphosphohydrolase [Duncaniella freteri]|jgi:dGTPase|uniref:DNTP triphosphohydrolase n=16 Tax=Duncaniella TaxID=2518495 RepID=A0A4Z0V5L1_9BACT|nr:dNTP triphosphohydrolase [Duncaniella freteri]TGG36765.1 dNTP triphosphohydrolase [Duncaniella freteri]